MQLHVLSGGPQLHDRVPALLQAGDTAVLRGEAGDGLRHHRTRGLRKVLGWILEVGFYCLSVYCWFLLYR